MESANQGQFDDCALAGRFHRMCFRTILIQRPVRTMTMIITQVVRENAAQMFLVQKDDVVQAFPAEGADQAFDHWILPRGARRNELLLQA